MTDHQEQLQSELVKIARKESIAHSLSSDVKPSLSEIKNEARQKEEEARIVADKLSSEEFFLDEKTKNLVGHLQKVVAEKFPNFSNIGLVVLGSSVHGGREVRQLLGTSKETDLDMAITMDRTEDLDSTTLGQITELIGAEIAKSGKEFGFENDFHLCPKQNPNEHHSFNLDTIDEVFGLLHYPQGGLPMYEEKLQLLRYFYPSIPEEVNKQNQYFVLEALRQIHRENPQTWQMIVETLSLDWMTNHKLQLKHVAAPTLLKRFGINNEDDLGKLPQEEREKLDQLLTSASIVMNRPFRQLLESTGA